MNFWSKISTFIGSIQTGSVHLIDRLQSFVQAAGEMRRSVAFTVAMIALSAKMAKADGVVTHDEVLAFRELFDIPPHEEANVARLFNLAQQDVAGYEAYAKKLAVLFLDEAENKIDVLDGLFHIAKADGIVHSAELAYLERVAEIFKVDPNEYSRLKARHVRGGGDPYEILGVSRDLPFSEIRRNYLNQVKETHPDRLVARGVPEEFVRLASDRLSAINVAFEKISAEHNL
ncbi:J domain-containing protein [Polycladidibacter stylochi]|uniref:J domain-containing protein n=1 Tax=Polycladidibacter stylochi TaxID=1807766 RepID=UPI000829BD2B|nr:DnaJ family molecular chaperone [Pseudovibrio stylochi]